MTQSRTRWHTPRALIALVAICLLGVAAPPKQILRQATDTIARDFPLLTATIFHSPQATNGLFSPAGIRDIELAAYLGATGDTAKELSLDLGLGRDTPELLASWRRKQAQSRAQINSDKTVWQQASAFWTRSSQNAFRLSYLNLLRDGMQIEATALTDHADDAALTMLAWFQQHDMPPLPYTPSNGLIITQTATFQAPWDDAVDWRLTRNAPFAIQGTTNSVIVPTLFAHRPLLYAEGPLLKLTTMTYAGGSHHLVLILPHTPLSPPGLAALATPERINNLCKAARPHHVDMSLPLFDLQYSTSVIPALKSNKALRRLLDPARAQLDGMLIASPAHSPPHLSELIQTTRVALLEDGIRPFPTTPAQQKQIGCQRAPSLPEVTFHANQPFLFLIVHPESETTLFAGWVGNPAT